MLARQTREEQSWNLRFVGKWFIPDLRQLRYDGADFRWGEAKLGVFGAETPRYLGRVRCLIILCFVEADGESANRTGRLRLHECDNRRAIDPSGKESAERYVGDHALPNRSAEQPIKLGVDFVVVDAEQMALAGLRDRGERPIAPGPFPQAFGAGRRQILSPDRKHCSGRQLEDALPDTVLVRHPALAQHHRQGPRIDDGVETRIGKDRLQFGSEKERAISESNIERLLAHAIADKVQNPMFAVPDAGGKHPGKQLERFLDAIAFKRGEHDLRVAVATEAMAFGLESRPQSGEIIDLAIERHHEIFIFRQHRLVAGVGQINDRKAAMTESDAALAVEPYALAVRPAMIERRCHRIDRHKMTAICCVGEENAGDTTHLVSSMPAAANACGLARRPNRLRLRARKPAGG